jgi:hypothetical protein
MVCGAALMALAGLVGALCRIARCESRPWSPIVWLGLVLGVTIGPVVYFGSFDAFFQTALQPIASTWYVWLGAVFASGACGAVGGVLASLAAWVRKPREHSLKMPIL